MLMIVFMMNKDEIDDDRDDDESHDVPSAKL